jgi:hypothetical protein
MQTAARRPFSLRRFGLQRVMSARCLSRASCHVVCPAPAVTSAPSPAVTLSAPSPARLATRKKGAEKKLPSPQPSTAPPMPGRSGCGPYRSACAVASQTSAAAASSPPPPLQSETKALCGQGGRMCGVRSTGPRLGHSQPGGRRVARLGVAPHGKPAVRQRQHRRPARARACVGGGTAGRADGGSVSTEGIRWI